VTKRAQLADGRILEFPDNTPDAVIQKVVKQQIKQAPAPKKEDRSFVGRAYDAVFGEPEAPKPYTAEELASRQGTIAERRARLLAQATQLEARAKTTPGRIDRGPDQAQALRDGAQRVRGEVAALDRELARINETGRPVPEASYIREPLSAAARMAYTGVSSFPGVVGSGLGRGLGALGLPGAEFLKEKSAKYLANVEKAGEYVAGAEGEGVQYDTTAKLLTDVAGGAGSMASFALPGGVARLTGAGRGLTGAAKAEAISKAALPGQYALGMGQGAQQGVEDIRAYEQRTGKEVPDANAFAAILLNAGLGAAEVGVFNRLVERLPVAQRGAAMEKVASTISRMTKGKVDPTAIAKAVGKEITQIEANTLGRIAIRGGAEAAQEGGVQAGSNIIAKGLYDEERDLMEGVGRSALVGGIVGGGVRSIAEASGYLGKRAADSRQKALDIIAANEEATATFDINVPNREDPTQQDRITVQTMGRPDADGNVIVMQPNGIPTRMNVEDLDRMRVPTEGFRATKIPETLSKQNIEARLVQSLGNTAPDEDAESYIKNVSSQLNKGMAAGKPEDIDTFFEKQKKSISKARISEDAKIARMLVLDEAAKARDEYFELLTAPPEGTAPTQVEGVAEAPTEQVAPTTTLADEIEQRAAEREAAAQEREELFRQIAENPDVVDKMGAFADTLASKGLEAPNMRESTSLRDIVRRDSELETTAARVEDIHSRERMVARMNVIEPIIYDPDIKGENKQKKINADLKRRNMEPLTPDEVDRVYGFEAAEAVFGPEGEFQQRLDAENAKRSAALEAANAKRSATFERILRDPAIKDKYRAFIGQVDKNNWDAPNGQEMAALRGDAKDIESLIPTAEDKLAQRTPAPVVEAPVEAPVVEAPVEAPVVEAPVEAPVVEAPVEAPVVEAPVEAPVVEAPVEAPVVGAPVEAPPAPAPVAAAPTPVPAPVVAPPPPPVTTAFVEYDATNLAFAPDVPLEIQGIVRGWHALLFPDTKLYFSTFSNAADNAAKLKPQFPQIAKAAAMDNAGGLTQQTGINEHYILYRGKNNISRMLETIAHEMGHVHMKEVFEKASPEVRAELKQAYEQWLTSQKGKTGREFVESLRARIAGRTLQIANPNIMADDIDQQRRYWKSFSEWYADQTARWAVSDAVPLSVVDNFFSKLARSLLAFYKSARAQRFLPTETFKKFITEVSNDLDLTPLDVRQQEEAAEQAPVQEAVQEEEITYDDVLDEIEGAFLSDPTEGKEPEITEQAYRLLKGAAENQRATPAEIMRKLEEYKDKYATEQGFGAPQLEQTTVTASPLPNGPAATPSNPRIETLGFAAENQARFKKLRSWAIRKFNFKYRDAVDYSRALASIYGVTTLPPNLNVAQKFELLESRKIGNQMSLRRWYLDPLENKIKELELDPQDVDMYLWARSAKDRNAMVRKSSKGEITDGSGMSDVDADMVLNELALRGLTPKLRQVAKIHDSLVDFMGKQRVESGMLSKDAWKEMRKAQPFYTPLKGFGLEGDMLADGSIDTKTAEAREASARGGGSTRIREYIAPRGRTSIPSSPIANIQNDAQMAIARIERNRVSQALLEAALNDPTTHADVVKVYSEKKVPGAQMLTGEALTNIRRKVSGDADSADRIFLVKKDGNAYYLDFQKTDAGNALFRAFANMTPDEVNKFLAPLQTISNGIKSLKTRFNPSYLLGTAWQRDFQEAIMTNYSAQGIKGGPAEGKKIAAKSAKYMFSPLQSMIIRSYLNGVDPENSKLVTATKFGATPEKVDEMALLFDQFLRDGGAVGNSMVMDTKEQLDNYKKALKQYEELSLLDNAKDRARAAAAIAKLPFDFMDTMAQVMDMQARFATYRAALDEKISRDDAASLALDSSLNLTRRGEWAPVLDTWAFFFSAGVEGGRKFVKQGMTSRNAKKVIFAAIKLGVVAQLLNYFINGGDDDEDGRKNIYDVNDATRQSRTVLYYGPGTNDYVAIPMAFSLGFAKYAGEQFTSAFLGEISPMEAAVTTADAFRNMALPIRGSAAKDLGASAQSILTPDLGQPFVDLGYNTNFFGGKIFRENKFGDTPPSELGREDTAEAWKWIAQGANSLTNGTSTVSGDFSRAPEWYQYLATQYGGGLASVTGDVLSGKMPDLFKVAGKGGEYAPMSNFYENTTDMDAIYPTYKKVNGSPDAEEAPEYDETDEAALAENQKAFPLQTQPEIMEAYGEATKQLKDIRKTNREDGYADIEDYYADMNEVYKEFNRTYNEVKKRK
jgi:hypothetical protein